MGLVDRIAKDCHVAMKARDRELVGILRYVMAQIKNRQIANRGELSEPAVEEVLRREAKRRGESMAAYERAGRPELVEREKTELRVIERYLPQMMSRSEVERLVDLVMDEVGPGSESSGFGRIMAVVMKRSRGRADGKLVAEIVKKRLV